MPRKVLLGSLCASLVLAGCATVRDQSLPPAPAPVESVNTPTVKPKPAPARTTTKPKPRKVSRPAPPKPGIQTSEPNRADLPSLIGAGAAWSSPDFRSLAVRRGDAAGRQPVPIFRQAGTLAAVRAALANSPAQPQAEFRNGVLTLKFDRGSNEEIASAVNKTLSVTGSRNLQVALQP